jgi:hypothetical protein
MAENLNMALSTFFIKCSVLILNSQQHYLELHSPTKKDIVSFRELDSTIFGRFFAADYDSVLECVPARQDSEIIGLLSVKIAFTAIYKSSDFES